MKVDQSSGGLTEAALAQSPRPIFGRHLYPHAFPGIGAGHAAVETGELRVLVDGQRAPRVRVPAGTARLCGRGCSRDVQTDGSDLGYLHGGSLSSSHIWLGGATSRRLGQSIEAVPPGVGHRPRLRLIRSTQPATALP